MLAKATKKAKANAGKLLSVALGLMLCLALAPTAVFAIGAPPAMTGDDHITFSSNEAFSIEVNVPEEKPGPNKGWNGTVEYSTDNSTWTAWDGGKVDAVQKDGTYYLCFRGNGNTVITGGYDNRWLLTAEAGVACNGNIMTLLRYSLNPNGATMGSNCFHSLFRGWTELSSAPELPATTLSESCYDSMFYNCEILTSAPALPAEIMKDSCYNSMFYGCKSLTKAPALSATTLERYCYSQMFYACTGLTSAPALPAETLSNHCYSQMFSGCTSLKNAPVISATALDRGCFSQMFQGCTSLTTAPELKAATMAYGCCENMFSGCTALTTAPALPATSLDTFCYHAMFEDCTALTKAPELKASAVGIMAYAEMFKGCTSLKNAPALPATTLAMACYQEMFSGCTALTAAPALSATELQNSCYKKMFEGCTGIKLNKTGSGDTWGIPAGATAEGADNWNQDMFKSTGGDIDAAPVIGTTYYYETGTTPTATYTVSFDMNGHGTSPEAQTVESGKTAARPADPTAEGWAFCGWYADSALTKTFYFTTPITENTTVYAMWKKPIAEATATITEPVAGQYPDITPVSGDDTQYTAGGEASLTEARWYVGSAEHDKNTAFTAGTEYTPHIAFRAKDGYCFTDSTVFKINGITAETVACTGNPITIRVAKHAFTAADPATTYTVTFNANGGTCGTTTMTTDASGKLASLPTATWTNLEFVGWFNSKTDSKITTDTVFTENTTIDARWKISNVTFGMTKPEAGKKVSECKDLSFTTPAFTKDDWAFKFGPSAWYEKGNDTPLADDAVFEAGKTYVFKTDGISMTNYRWVVWSESPAPKGTLFGQTVSGVVDPAQSCADFNFEVTTPASYTVTFEANGGTCGTTTMTTDADGKLTSLPTPTWTNLEFVGWFNSKTDSKITTDTVFTVDTTIYARWKISNATFSMTKPEAGKKVSECKDISFTTPAFAKDTDWTFIFDNPTWYEKGNDTPLADDVVFEAGKTYVFNTGGIRMTNYRWVVWSESPATKGTLFGQTVSGVVDPAQAYAFFKFEVTIPTTYTVTFDMNGHGTQIAAQTVKSGKTAARPADPSESGWTFGGWYADSALETAFDFNKAITADAIVYAKWTASGPADDPAPTPEPGKQRPLPVTGDSLPAGLLALLAVSAIAALACAATALARRARVRK